MTGRERFMLNKKPDSCARRVCCVKRNRAFAIIMAVLVLTALAIIAIPFAYTTRQHETGNRAQLAKTQALIAADGAMNWAHARLLKSHEAQEAVHLGTYSFPTVDTPDELHADLEKLEAASSSDFDVANSKGIILSAEVWDEQGKININDAEQELIYELLRRIKIPLTNENILDLVNVIVLYRQNHRPFRSLEEINRAVDVIGQDLKTDLSELSLDLGTLDLLRRHATVYSPRMAPGIRDLDDPVPGSPAPVNINTATAEVLATMFIVMSHGEVTEDNAEDVASELKNARSKLVGDAEKNGSDILLENSSVFPERGWVSVEADLIKYTSNDTVSNSLLIDTSDTELGISENHDSGAEVYLAITSAGDFQIFLNHLISKGILDNKDEANALFEGCFQPGHTQLCFRSHEVYSIASGAIVNASSGMEMARASSYEVIQVLPHERQVLKIRGQDEFEELVRSNAHSHVTTWPNPVTIRDFEPDHSRTDIMTLPSAVAEGATSISADEVTGFFADSYVKLQEDDKKEIARIQSIQTEEGSETLILYGPLEQSFSKDATISDAGAVEMSPPEAAIFSNDTFVVTFDRANTADALSAIHSDGPPEPVNGSGATENIRPDGLHIKDASTAVKYSTYDTDTAANSNLAHTADEESPRKDLQSGAIEFWFKPDWQDRSKDYVLFDMAEGEFLNRVLISYEGESGGRGRLVFRIADNTLPHGDKDYSCDIPAAEMRVDVTNQEVEPVDSDDPIPVLDNVWYHLSAVWQGSGYGYMAMFIDGKSVGRYWPATKLKSTMLVDTTTVPSFTDNNVIPDYGPIYVHGEVINREEGAAPARHARGSVSSTHPAGSVVVPYGYSSTVFQKRGNVEYHQDHMINVNDSFGQLAEPLPASSVETTVYLGEMWDDTDGNIVAGELQADAEFIPVASVNEFGSSGYAFIEGERIYYGSVAQSLPIDGLKQDGNVYHLDTPALTNLERATLDTTAKPFLAGKTVKKISVRLTSNANVPLGHYNPGTSFFYNPGGSGEREFVSGRTTENAYVEIGNEWIGYVWPSLDNPVKGEFLVGVGVNGLEREPKGGTASQNYVVGTRLNPVFMSNGKIGRGDRITIVDNRANNATDNAEHRETAVVKWISRFYDNGLFSLEEPIEREFLYDKECRIIKFPSCTFSSYSNKGLPETLQPNFFVGNNALSDTLGEPPAPASAIVDEVKITHLPSDRRPYTLFHTPSGGYANTDGDGNPDPPIDKTGTGDGISDSLIPPFGLILSGRNRKLDEIGNPAYSPVNVPACGYLKIDNECMFFQRLYTAPNMSPLYARGDGHIAQNSSVIPVDSTDGFPDQGYLSIIVEVLDSRYEPWMSDPVVLAYLEDLFGEYYDEFSKKFIFNETKNKTEYVFYDEKTPTSFIVGSNRGLLGSTALAGQVSADGTDHGRVALMQTVEIEILERGALGTEPGNHLAWAPVMVLENIPTALLAGPMIVQDDTGTLKISATTSSFPVQGILQIGPSNHPELVAYTSMPDPRTFTVPIAMRERYGTLSRTDEDNEDLLTSGDLLTIELDETGSPIDPTPYYWMQDIIPNAPGGDDVYEAANHIVRLIPYRYWDGMPKPFDEDGVIDSGDQNDYDGQVDYNADGATYLRVGKMLPNTQWRGLAWNQLLPEEDEGAEKDDQFHVRAVLRVNDNTAPAWNEDPELKCGDGEEDGLLLFKAPPEIDSEDLDESYKYLDNIMAWGDDLEVRFFFVFPQHDRNYEDPEYCGAYAPTKWLANRWKMTPSIEDVAITYESGGPLLRILHKGALGY